MCPSGVTYLPVDCCFSELALYKSKDGLAQNQNNVSEWSDISTRGLLFQ